MTRHALLDHGPARKAVVVSFRLLLAALALVASGCGNAIYAVNASGAESKLEEARQLGAEELAAYEYYYAKAHLEKAATEAAEAEYGNAAALAEISEEYASKAARLSREARRSAGR